MKKMRKLVPAFAMLMVAAIMMSTASFAWFTMNDQVTATGMQVQAKASGNLLIDTDKMTATSSGIKVDFGGTKADLIPVTFVPATGKDLIGSHATSAGAWYDAADVEVDAIYGTADGDLNGVTPTATADDHFSEYVVYLATAGDEFDGNLKFDLDAIANADSTIANAYTVALYVAADNQTKANIDWTKPTYVYNQLTNKNETNAWVDTGVEVTVPSTYGKVAETAVGLMVVIRVYVDGALEIAGGVSVPATKVITAVGDEQTYQAATMSGWTFYTDAAGTTPYDSSLLQEGQLLSTVVASYWNGQTQSQPNADATYVNNTTVPSAGTSFAIDFKVE